VYWRIDLHELGFKTICIVEAWSILEGLLKNPELGNKEGNNEILQRRVVGAKPYKCMTTK
jgi:hypothetical protein